MLGLMMDVPLLVTSVLRHAETAHGGTEIVARTIDGHVHRYSYATASQRCRRLAHAVRTLRLAEGDRVGSLAWNTYHHFELFYGITGQGVVLHTINPRLHDDTLVMMINHAEDRWIFIDEATLPLAERIAARLPPVVGWILMNESGKLPQTSLPNIVSYEHLLAAQPDRFDWPQFDERAASVICYTSGTTGDPKGVVYSHRSLVLAALFMSTADMIGAYRSGQRESVMPIAPLFHANGWMMPFTAPMSGQKLVLPGRNFEAEKLYELMDAEDVTIAAAVPTVWLALAKHLQETGLELRSLRAAMVAGTKAPRALVEFFEGRGIAVGQVWGMTEAAGGVRATLAPGTSELPREEQFARTMRQGRMGFGTQLRLVDDAAAPLPHDGVALGHLQARGPCVASGYYRQTPGEPDDWLATGDVARIHPDGSIEIVDRSKDIIKSGGEWISSVAIENAALDHPDLLQAAVVGVDHPIWQERPLLFAVRKADATVSQGEILDFLRPLVPKWWLPDEVAFVDGLPTTATGKVRKTVLRDWAAARRPAAVAEPAPSAVPEPSSAGM